MAGQVGSIHRNIVAASRRLPPLLMATAVTADLSL